MANPMQYCSLHKIAYNTTFDPTCPQCSLGRMSVLPDQHEWFGAEPVAAEQPRVGPVIGPPAIVSPVVP